MGLVTQGTDVSIDWKNAFRKVYFHLCMFTANLLSIIIGIVLTWDLNCQAEEYGTKAWIYSSLPLTAIPMPFIISFVASRWGRKLSLLLSLLPLLLSDMVLYFSTCSTPPKTFLIARSLSGISLGGLTTILPIYIQELSHSAKESSMGLSPKLFTSLGVFISFSNGGSTLPHVLISSTILILIVLLMSFMPETPQFLIKRKRELRAKAVLIKLKNSSLIDADFRILCQKNQPVKCRTGWINYWKMQGPILKQVVVMVLLKECTSANIVIFYARDMMRYANSINNRVLPPWEPPGVGVQVGILGVAHCLAAGGLWQCLNNNKSERHHRCIVGTCFVIVCVVGLIPLTWYFHVINEDASSLTNGKIVKKRLMNITDSESASVTKLNVELTSVSQNVQLTCWVPLVTFWVILTCHFVLGLRIDAQINESQEMLWTKAFCESWTWILWFLCGIVFKSMDLDPMVENNIWIWWCMCGFGCFLGVAVTFAYLPNEIVDV